MKTCGVIPARYGSTRFPGKPLVEIAGKPLLQWVVEAAQACKSLDQVLVATDDERIAELAKKIHADVAMTSPDCATGSDRVWQAVQELDVDVILNIQGDEPLIEASVLDQLLQPFSSAEEIQMATLARQIRTEDLDSINTAKIVCDHLSNAIYFSRFAIPFSRNQRITQGVCKKHIGIYAYRKSFLKTFCNTKPCDLEQAEGLEQLRALYLGAKIRVVDVDHDSWGVDTPEDVFKVEAKLRHRS